jgi:hypothetical protein
LQNQVGSAATRAFIFKLMDQNFGNLGWRDILLDGLGSLTSRERQALGNASLGQTNKLIA